MKRKENKNRNVDTKEKLEDVWRRNENVDTLEKSGVVYGGEKCTLKSK